MQWFRSTSLLLSAVLSTMYSLEFYKGSRTQPNAIESCRKSGAGSITSDLVCSRCGGGGNVGRRASASAGGIPGRSHDVFCPVNNRLDTERESFIDAVREYLLE